MCGRFAMNKETNELIEEFVTQGGDLRDWNGVYSVAPTQTAPIVRARTDDNGNTTRELNRARWDWPKPPNRPTGAPIINARIEKLPTGFWAGAFSSARCIVPMTGYYEWTGKAGAKIPHFIHGNGLLAAAGLTWHMDVGNGARQRVFVVVTREARDASGEVHDRMPAFLTRDMWDTWLDPVSLTIPGDTAASRANREQLVSALLASSDQVAGTIREYIVDRKVNNTRTVDPTDPTLIEPVEAA